MNPDLMAADPSVEGHGVEPAGGLGAVPSMFAAHTWAWVYIVGSMAALVLMHMFFKRG